MCLALALLAPLAALGESYRAYRAVLPTADGTRIALYRYLPASGEPPTRTVLLLPDVGMTHHLFDYDGRGLAPFLARRGVEVFAVEWRGAGRSEVPLGGYQLEELLENDAEAALAKALTGRGRVMVVGVGLGGTVGLALAGRHPSQIAGLVAMQTPAVFDVPNEPLGRLIDSVESAPPWIPLPKWSQQLLFGRRSWFEVMLAGDDSLARDFVARMGPHLVAPIPKRFGRQLVGFARDGAVTVGGKRAAELAKCWPGPTLLVVAPRDNWIHPEFAWPLRDLLPKERTKLLVLNRLEGAHFDYGHVGMLLGSRAQDDVFDPVLRFIWSKGADK